VLTLGGRWSEIREGTVPRIPMGATPSAGGSASPQGEARRECAAKPKRSAGRGREDYGWGWAGGVTKPNQAISPPPAGAH